MKREKRFCKIKPFTPWFWRTCDICGHEYNHEPIWRIIYHFSGATRYICKECAPNYDVADSLAGSWGKYGSDRPKARYIPIKRS